MNWLFHVEIAKFQKIKNCVCKLSFFFAGFRGFYIKGNIIGLRFILSIYRYIKVRYFSFYFIFKKDSVKSTYSLSVMTIFRKVSRKIII